MKLSIHFIPVVAACALFITACKNKPAKSDARDSFWAECDVVATKETVGGDTVVVLDAYKVHQKRNIPLELLVQDYEVIKLDNTNDEALIGQSRTSAFFSENYIGVAWMSSFPFKLFRKDGTFVRHIGGFGQGPNEYIVIDDAVMDEKNDRIYILPFDSRKILVYDFEGNGYSYIKLHTNSRYASKMVIDREKRQVTVTKKADLRSDYLIWVQDFDGNLLQGVKSSDYYPDMTGVGMWTCTCLHGDNVEEFSLVSHNTNNYLYHYDMDNNRLVPKFTTRNYEDVLAAINVYDLPHHYAIRELPYGGGGDDHSTRRVIVDKATLRGCDFEGFITPEGILLNHYDMLMTMSRGYFHLVDFGSEILERIKKIDRTTLTGEQRARLVKLEALIGVGDGDDDCSLLFRGKFIR